MLKEKSARKRKKTERSTDKNPIIMDSANKCRRVWVCCKRQLNAEIKQKLNDLSRTHTKGERERRNTTQDIFMLEQQQHRHLCVAKRKMGLSMCRNKKR